MGFLAKVIVIFLSLVLLYLFIRWAQNLTRSMRIMATPPSTPEEMFEHNLTLYRLDGPIQAAQHIRDWILRQYIYERLQPRLVDINRLRDLGGIVSADKEGRHLFSDARYEMIGFPRMRIFFRWDWTLAGIKFYEYEIETRVKEVTRRKKLTTADCVYFQRFQLLSAMKVNRDGEYGGPGFPFPDERYQLNAPLSGDQLYFDQNYELIVHMHRATKPGQQDEYFWELPGARQPQYYEACQVVYS